MRTRHLPLRMLAVGLLTAGLTAMATTTPAAAAGTNLALGKTATASSFTDVYPAGNLNDGNPNSYWESANNAFPQWAQIDLGSAQNVNQLVLKLPPATSWATRTETLTVAGSTDGNSFSAIVGSAGYTFDPASGNAVTINFSTLSTRYVRLTITGNNGWPAGQLSEFEIYGPASGDTQPPSAPANLAYGTPASGQLALSWNTSTDNVGVTGYDLYRNGALLTSVTGTSYTDTAAGTGTVSYYVKARDAAGNVSAASNTVTRTASGGGTTNLAIGKPISGSANTYIYAPANANDNDVTSYFEGSSYPSTLTVKLGSNTDLSSIAVKLNPDSSWGARTQTIQVLGREQSASSFSALTSPTSYSFNPASGNSVTIPVSGRVADVELSITSNSGAPGGQVAEFQIYGTPAPNPDLTITGSSWSPTAPIETSPITVSATVRNQGSLAAGATSVNFYLGTTKLGTASVTALAAGASTTVSASIGTQNAGSYQLTAKVDESNSVLESDETNNSYTNPTALTVAPVASSDLLPVSISSSPTSPAAGNPVTFSAAIKNQGSVASAAGSHGITLSLLDSSGATVTTLSASYSGTIAAGASTAAINLGSWTAVNGNYTLKVTVAVDANELAVKQANNTVSQSFFVGRGAHLPYDMYEAEDGSIGGGAAVVGPNRIVGDLAGEASGRKAVTLNSTGAYVQWTTRASTNTLVTRFSIPDSSDGTGANSTLDVYVNGTFLKAVSLTSKYAWLYGAETSPNNSPQAGTQRHIYDEANLMLGTTVPARSTIKLQKDAANTSTYAIDFAQLEQVAPIANPDSTKYVVPAGFTQQNVQDALTAAANDSSKLGVYLPAGDYATAQKFQVSGRAIKVIGAGPWYTHFLTPQDQTNTDAGFSVQTTANGSTFSGFAFWGNYTSRIDGPGKVFDLTDVSNLTLDNIWVEHTVCFVWGTHVSNLTITNDRIRDTFADGINLNNGSQNNTVSNDESRSTGDDSFALFAAQDHSSADLTGNTFSNLTSLLTWRAAGIAVYGGEANTFSNLYVADTLVYAGITISSLDFGYPFQGFGTGQTVIQNTSLVRDGGHFWGGQSFPAIWCFSASKAFQGIRVSNVDITDPTYTGVMFQTNYVGGTAQNPVTDTVFSNVSISGAHHTGDAYDAKSGYAIWANPSAESGQGPAVGSATFNHTSFSNDDVNVQNPTSTFTVTLNP